MAPSRGPRVGRDTRASLERAALSGPRDALQEWNDEGGRLFHHAEPDRDAEDGEKKEDAFRARAEELAAWTQRELGAEYEVLFVTAGGTWQRAEPPGSTAC
jgi:hypothetical protein